MFLNDPNPSPPATTDGVAGVGNRNRVAGLSASGAVVGSADLQLQPRAAPKLALTTANLLVDLEPRESVAVPITIENGGGADAQDVVFDTTAPLGLSVDFQPVPVRLVRPRQPVTATMRVAAAADAVPGDYTLRVKVRTRSRLLTIESPEQTFRVTVRNPILGAGLVLPGGVLLLVLLGAGAFLLRRARG
ncbi:MAG TPA: NEW3 domain-containing protein [Thermoanaerobaculia bacterium]|nr:NEW3 domain-containing protein [Thermoanaerobaculia bacterium]